MANRFAANLDTLGLESFWNTVKALFIQETYISDENLAEKLRWQIQDKLWERLQPKTKLFKTVQIKTKIAVTLSKKRYLYLEPEFLLQPLSKQKIEYLSNQNDARVITYWLGNNPPENYCASKVPLSLAQSPDATLCEVIVDER